MSLGAPGDAHYGGLSGASPDRSSLEPTEFQIGGPKMRLRVLATALAGCLAVAWGSWAADDTTAVPENGHRTYEF